LARSCTICAHHRRDSMDRLLLRGEQINSVARRFSVSPDAVFRHKKHMQLVMAKAAAVTEHRDVTYGSALLAEVSRIRADAERLQLEYESRRDLRGALRAIETRLSVIELEARFTCQIELKQKNEVHLYFTPDRALAVAEAYVARHGSEKPLLVLEAAPSIEMNENEEVSE
jgi:hypothetical protein